MLLTTKIAINRLMSSDQLQQYYPETVNVDQLHGEDIPIPWLHLQLSSSLYSNQVAPYQVEDLATITWGGQALENFINEKI
ncbi:hypothetical protein L3X38_020725 [Prunus dulcis]|uniref:Uncharacterized protein n=1 Tax=Prunus dulcis TaxID=3755 RepID=A0AAD4ZDC2_PRUDU|nr:hypothetical protein L3X38_020725 [Prunus dulcis]